MVTSSPRSILPSPWSRPFLQANGRYPVLTDAYESTNVKGLFYAGALAHGRDFKRAAGGFIHGFRYTARALVRMLAETHAPNPVEWPHHVYSPVATLAEGASAVDAGDGGADAETPIANEALTSLSAWLLERINVGSAAYQMVHVLGDGVVLQCDQDRTHVNATYFEEMPLAHFHRRFRGLPRLTASFGYNGQVQSLEKSVKEGARSVCAVACVYVPMCLCVLCLCGCAGARVPACMFAGGSGGDACGSAGRCVSPAWQRFPVGPSPTASCRCICLIFCYHAVRCCRHNVPCLSVVVSGGLFAKLARATTTTTSRRVSCRAA